MTLPEHRARLIEFLKTIQRPDRSIQSVDDNANLVELGLADSLAVLQIISYLEETYGFEFPEQGIDTEELSSIRGILSVIDRQAK